MEPHDVRSFVFRIPSRPQVRPGRGRERIRARPPFTEAALPFERGATPARARPRGQGALAGPLASRPSSRSPTPPIRASAPRARRHGLLRMSSPRMLYTPPLPAQSGHAS